MLKVLLACLFASSFLVRSAASILTWARSRANESADPALLVSGLLSLCAGIGIGVFWLSRGAVAWTFFTAFAASLITTFALSTVWKRRQKSRQANGSPG